MRISLSVWSCHPYLFDGSWTNADFIRFASATGAEGVELLSIFWNETELSPVQEALEDTGLALACFGACNNLAMRDEAERQIQLQDILTSVDMAKRLGARVVRVFSGDGDGVVSYEQARAWIIAGLREAAAYAGRQEIVLCLENHGTFAGRAEQVAEIIAEVGSPWLRSTFDTANFLLVDEDPGHSMDRLKSLVRHVHIKDFAPVDESFAGETWTSTKGIRYAGKVTGEGSVHLPGILASLKEAGYRGWVTQEYEGGGDLQAGALLSVQRLKSLLDRS